MFGIKQVQDTLDLMALRMDTIELELSGLRRNLWQSRLEESEKWRTILQNLQQYNEAIATLADRVAALETIDDSAMALIQGFNDELKALITRSDGIVDLGQLQNLTAAIDAKSRKLAASVSEGVAALKSVTDPAPAPAPAPVAVDPVATGAAPSDGAAS